MAQTTFVLSESSSRESRTQVLLFSALSTLGLLLTVKPITLFSIGVGFTASRGNSLRIDPPTRAQHEPSTWDNPTTSGSLTVRSRTSTTMVPPPRMATLTHNASEVV